MDANTEIDEAATGTAAQRSFTLVATDADNVNRADGAPLPIATKTEIITYELVADTSSIDNEHATIDRNSGVLTFNEGVFDYENTNLRSDLGGKYFLIQVKATSTSTLPGAGVDAAKSATKTFKIYVEQANEAPSDLLLIDGINQESDDMAALKAAYDTLIGGDTDVTNIVDRVEAMTDALAAVSATHQNASIFAKLITAAQALLDHVNAQTGTPPTDPTAAEKLVALNIAAVADNAATALKTAFTNAFGEFAAQTGALAQREGRLNIEADGGEAITGTTTGTITGTYIGQLTVVDPDAGDTHTFTIGGPLADLFTLASLRLPDNSYLHLLVYTGGVAGLPRLESYVGSRFELPITVTDRAGESKLVNFSIVYESAFITTPALDAKADGDNDDPDVATPAVDPVKLPSGQSRDQTKSNDATPAVEVTQTVGSIAENADGSTTPVVIGQLSLAGVPLSKINGVNTDNSDYVAQWGTVDGDGVFTAAQKGDAGAALWLLYTGSVAPDYEVQQTAAALKLTFLIDDGGVSIGHLSGDGFRDVQADGVALNGNGDVDTRTFHYTGGAVTVTASKAFEAGQAGVVENVTNGKTLALTVNGTDYSILIVVDSTNTETTGAITGIASDPQNTIRVVVHANAATRADFMAAFNKNGTGLTLLGIDPAGNTAVSTRTSVESLFIAGTNYTAARPQSSDAPAVLTVSVTKVDFITDAGEMVMLEPTKMKAHPIRQMLNGSRSPVMVLSKMSMMACRWGLMTTFKRYQWIFDLVTENGRPRPRPPANRTRAFPAHSLVSTMTTAWRVLHLTVC
jgi:hypothetical protein